MNTLVVQLSAAKLPASREGIAIAADGVLTAQIMDAVASITAAPPADPLTVATPVANKEQQKYDRWLGEELLSLEYASSSLDIASAFVAAQDFAS
jgi:hypothetical protein